MRIAATDYSLRTKSLDIYVSGCNAPHCEGCHNPELWAFDVGEVCNEKIMKKIKDKVDNFPSLIDNIMIFGGEPLDQDHNELEKMLVELSKLNKSIWLFTKYDIDKIPQFVRDRCTYIKTGRYLRNKECENNTQYGITLATCNQEIHKLAA